MNYTQAMDFLNSTKHLGSVLGLDRVENLLKYLGNPENDLRFIHVTGTNGKGSTCEYLSSILQAAGYRTGLFTSPYIQKFNEQISINDDQISDDEFATCMTRIKDAIDNMLQDGLLHPTEFEIVVALAFEYFKWKNCDIVVLEVGYGGKGDATNVITTTELAVITPISIDHVKILGSTLEEIATEKSGIIKPGCSVVSSKQHPDVMRVLESTCHNIGVSINVCDKSATCTSFSLAGQTVSVPGFSFGEVAFPPIDELSTTLLGSYQLQNLCLAVYAAYVLTMRGYSISVEDIRIGVANAKWPGRFEVLNESPTIVIDGAHNADGIDSLVSSIERYLSGKKLIMINGVLADKAYDYMVNSMGRFAKRIFTVTVPSPRTLDAVSLAECYRSHGYEATSCNSLEEAVTMAREVACDDDVILAFGSLYFIGHIREIFQNS